MAWDDRVVLGGFCDEITRSKNLEVQLAVAAALGLESVTLRFLDLGQGVRNISQLTDDEARLVARQVADHGLRTGCVGSPLGKVKLLDVDDGSVNRYRPPAAYLADEVERVCRVAELLECRLVRGFSFYPPVGDDPARHVDAVIERLKPVVRRCDDAGLTFGLEVEANLTGHTAGLLTAIAEGVGHPALLLVFDGANLVTQGFDTAEVFDQWRQMLPWLGWLHVKDHRRGTGTQQTSGPTSFRQIDEAALDGFVPAGEGASGYDQIFVSLRQSFPSIRKRLEPRGIDGLLVDLEPHVAGGGQFGGFSGPAGFARSLAALRTLLEGAGIGYRLRG